MMRLEPERNLSDGSPRVVHSGDPAIGMFLQVEVTEPPSMKGKKGYVYFTLEDTRKLLLEFRDLNVRARR